MNRIFCQLLFLLFTTTASAQFAGYYVTHTKKPEIRLLMEKSGRYHIFANDVYYHGRWKLLGSNKAEIVLDNIDQVDLYVSTGNKRSGEIWFTGFADKKAFFKTGGSQVYRPVFKEKPKCSYSNKHELAVNRSTFNEITIAINKPDDTADTHTTLYTYQIPEKYDEIYIDVNSNATRAGKILILEYRENQYVIEGVQFKKQPAGKITVPRMLAEQQQLLSATRINKFKKDHYVNADDIKRITPAISRKMIKVVDGPLFVIQCPDVNDFPPVVAPPPGKRADQ